MTNIPNAFSQVDTELMQQAEVVLDKLGVTTSNVINLLFRQIVSQNAIPISYKELLSHRRLTKEEFDEKIQRGIADIEAGRTHLLEDVEAQLKQDYGI